jgi:23S rRNA pseudouridine2605 synthase
MDMDMHDPVRINKYLAQCGVASRRGADELVQSGRVTVNGRLADQPGLKVVPGQDEVAVDGRPVTLATDPPLVLALHKPVQVVTTLDDPQGRPTVLSLLPRELADRRPVPVGRLDYFSEGLLLMTTDGDLCHRLTHPSHHLDKVYEVSVRPAPSSRALEAMRAGMTLAEGKKLAPVRVEPGPASSGRQVLTLTLIQGVNRQIRRMCRDLGLTVLKIKRVGQGPVSLGDLKPGQYRILSQKETTILRKAVGL